MKEETRKIYRCDHCEKYYLRKHFVEPHEILCKKNPENSRPCFECEYLSKLECYVVDHTPWGGENNIEMELLYCNKKDHFLYTPQNETKQNYFDVLYLKMNNEESSNEPMPKECEFIKLPGVFSQKGAEK